MLQVTFQHINIVLIYVNDIIIVESSFKYINVIVRLFNDKFSLKDLDPLSYSRNDETLHLSNISILNNSFLESVLKFQTLIPTYVYTFHLSKYDSVPLSDPNVYTIIIDSLQYYVLITLRITYPVNKLFHFTSSY